MCNRFSTTFVLESIKAEQPDAKIIDRDAYLAQFALD